MRTIETTPSELILAHDCQRAHHYRYERKLRRLGEKKSPTLASGIAVHYAVEHWLWDKAVLATPTMEDLAPLVKMCLQDEWKDQEPADREKNIKRFTPGVLRALSRIPQWVWDSAWEAEPTLNGAWSSGALGIAGWPFPGTDIHLYMHGRPDFLRLYTDQEGTDTCEIVDIKTTKTAPLSYVLWSPQIRFYAAMCQQRWPERLIVYRYLCVPTGPKDEVKDSPTFILDKAMYEFTIQEMFEFAAELDGQKPRYLRRCDWCPYNMICISRILGTDGEGIINQLYATRELDSKTTRVVELAEAENREG